MLSQPGSRRGECFSAVPVPISPQPLSYTVTYIGTSGASETNQNTRAILTQVGKVWLCEFPLLLLAGLASVTPPPQGLVNHYLSLLLVFIKPLETTESAVLGTTLSE